MIARRIRKLPRSHLRDIGKHPTGHGSVEHKQQVIAGKPHPLEVMPLAANRLKHVKRTSARLLAATTDRKLHSHDGQAQDNHEHQVHEDEGRAAILARNVREAPDVSQANGASSADKDEPQPRSELFPFHVPSYHATDSLTMIAHFRQLAESYASERAVSMAMRS